jgi:prolipoprotein diacylglyceryltransferase
MTVAALSDRLTQGARLELGHRPAFRVCGYAGLVAGAALAVAVVRTEGGSVPAMGAIAVAAVLTFLAVAYAHVVLTGEERLVYYHHEIAVLAVAGATAALLGAPVLVHLDATALGVGAFLAFGRVGCFMVGCCHGRPHRWGVRYDAAHGDAGLAWPLVGVRLFPLQLIEAALVALVVAAGAVMVAAGAAPGAAFTFYVAVYALVRFGLEFVRGDAERPYWHGFSQPQWLSLACSGAVAAAAVAGLVPARPWDATVVVIGLAMLLARRRPALRAAEVQEVVTAIRASMTPDGAPPDVVRTSRGLSVSAGPGHVTVSGEIGDALERELARIVPGVLGWSCAARVTHGRGGVRHIVARP